MRRTAAIITFAATSLAALAAPTSAAGRAWELNRATGREVVIGAGQVEFNPWGGSDAQAIFVSVPGSPTGAQPSKATKITPESVGVARFYRAVDSGDVDGDGDGDLVLGARDSGTATSGTLVVIPGGRGGPLRGSAYKVPNPRVGNEVMGHSVHIDDVDLDGFADVITSHTIWPDAADSGYDFDYALTVFWGGATPLNSDRSTTFDVQDTLAYSEYKPLLLDAGQLGGHRRYEIVVVEPGDADYDSGDSPDPGAISLCRVSTARNIFCGEARPTPANITAMAVGYFDDYHSGYADVVLGSSPWPHRSRWRSAEGGGRAYVYPGDSTGLAEWAVTSLSQATPGVPGGDEDRDYFGSSLAVADVDRNGRDDLVVGAPGEDSLRGRVTLLYGHPKGLGRALHDRTIDQNTSGVPGTSERFDSFGFDVSLLDVDGNGFPDLITGAAGENNNRGAVTIIRSNAEGRLVPSRSQALYAGSLGIDSAKSPGLGAPLGK